MRKLKDVSVRTKLFGGFGIVLLLSAVLGVLLMGQIGSVNAGGVYIATNTLPSIQLIDDIRANEETYRADQMWNITNTNLALSTAPIHGLLAARAQIAADLRRYQRSEISNATDARLLKAVRAQWEAYVAATPKLNLATSNTTQKPIVALANSSAVTFQRLRPGVNAWIAFNRRLAQSKTSSNASTYSSARFLGTILLAVALLVGLIVAVMLTRSIKGATDEMLGAAEAISKGEVDVEIRLEARDELGLMASAFRRMIAYIREQAAVAARVAEGDLTVEPEARSERDVLGNALVTLVGELRLTMSEVSASAGQISGASQEMAANSEQAGKANGAIAGAVEQIASGAERQVRVVEAARLAAEEVGRAVGEAAEAAQRSAEVAADARATADDGVNAAEQATDAMRSVRESSLAVTEAIQELALKSEQIGAIVATITGIAEQTNLLALNAAIEAARAGEHGRGFAVVAEEVRKLAEGSQKAAEEIAQLIGTIQGETSRAVAVVQSGSQRTEDGAAVVERTRDAFVSIGAAVADMSARVEQVAAVSQQIAASAESMQDSIGQAASVAEEASASTQEVSASTEQNSASAQEVAASAQQLAGNAEALDRLVGKFKLPAAPQPAQDRSAEMP